MRLLVFFPLFLVLVSKINGNDSANFIHDHLQNRVNYSVDPCEDFFRHACPTSHERSFLEVLVETKDRFVEDHRSSHPFYQRFSSSMLLETESTLEDLKTPTPITNYFAGDIADFSYDGFENFTMDQKDDFLQNIVNRNSLYNIYKQKLNFAFDGYIASLLFNEWDLQARHMFEKIKSAIRKSIEHTPWAKTYNSSKMFQDALDQINLYTFSDGRDAVKVWMDEYNAIYNECLGVLTRGYGSKTGSALCDVLALHKSHRNFNQQNIPVMTFIGDDMISDKISMFSVNETIVYISNPVLLLFSSDFPSDVYGSIGFTLLHEVFHSLVFGEDDHAEQHPLIPYWTKNSECVAEQSRKTCETFPTIRGLDWEEQGCTPDYTFEEDAADIAAYRIAWDMYRKTYTRKTPVLNAKSLNKEQLFFYGASTLLCFPEAMKIKQNLGDKHTNPYQRINTLMSQMPSFSKAFGCKPSDKMVKNKAKHCVLYGPEAPMTRKNSVN